MSQFLPNMRHLAMPVDCALQHPEASAIVGVLLRHEFGQYTFQACERESKPRRNFSMEVEHKQKYW